MKSNKNASSSYTSGEHDSNLEWVEEIEAIEEGEGLAKRFIRLFKKLHVVRASFNFLVIEWDRSHKKHGSSNDSDKLQSENQKEINRRAKKIMDKIKEESINEYQHMIGGRRSKVQECGNKDQQDVKKPECDQNEGRDQDPLERSSTVVKHVQKDTHMLQKRYAHKPKNVIEISNPFSALAELDQDPQDDVENPDCKSNVKTQDSGSHLRKSKAPEGKELDVKNHERKGKSKGRKKAKVEQDLQLSTFQKIMVIVRKLLPVLIILVVVGIHVIAYLGYKWLLKGQ